jgi:hypothetical protein
VIGDPGAEALCVSLKSNRTLRRLDLGANIISNRGGRAVFELLSGSNPYILHIGLVDNPLDLQLLGVVQELLTKRHEVALPACVGPPFPTCLPACLPAYMHCCYIRESELTLKGRHVVPCAHRHSLLPTRTHLDRHKDSEAQLLSLRVYTPHDRAVYMYPTNTTLRYPCLPAARPATADRPGGGRYARLCAGKVEGAEEGALTSVGF